MIGGMPSVRAIPPDMKVHGRGFHICLLLDSPPSVNGLFPTGRDGRRHLSAPYKSWRKAQGRNLMVQRVTPVNGRVKISITVAEGGKDLDNHTKAAIDCLVHFGLIDGDGPKVVREIVLRWGTVPDLLGAPMGCMIEVESLPPA